MTPDLAELKRKLRAAQPYQGKSAQAFLCHEAADAIDAQAARIEALEAGLKKTYDIAAGWNAQTDARDFQRIKTIAREALGDHHAD